MVIRKKQIENRYYLELTIDEIKKTYCQELKVGEVSSDDGYDYIIPLLKELGYVQVEKIVSEINKSVEDPISKTSSQTDNKLLILKIVGGLRDSDFISISLIQRIFSVGFSRAAKIFETMKELGIIIESKKGRYVFTEKADDVVNLLRDYQG